MQRRNDQPSTADLNHIIDEFSGFLLDELDKPTDVRGLTHMKAIQSLWDAIQRSDPSPMAELSAYIGDVRLGHVADSLLFEVVSACAGNGDVHRTHEAASPVAARRGAAVTPYYDEDGITIYHGDCREVLPSLAAGSTHLLLTDPPYGIGYVGGRGQFKGKHIEGDDGGLDVVAAVKTALRCVKFNRHFYVFGPADLSDVTVGATVELIWDEGKFSGGDLSLPWGNAHERITFGVWNPYPSQKGAGNSVAQRLRRGSVISVPTTNSGRGAKNHPTDKPVLLLRQLIEASTLFGEAVLDPFMGAGSTLVAAQREERQAIGVELDERYCETAAKRLSQGALGFEGAE